MSHLLDISTNLLLNGGEELLGDLIYISYILEDVLNCISTSKQVLNFYQGWQPAFTAGIIRRLKPDKTGPDNTPKSGFYRLLLAFTIFLHFSSTKTVLSFYMFIK